MDNMNFLQTLHCRLQHDPRAGIIAGFSSAGLARIQHLLTNDQILKAVAGIGTWCSSILSVAALLVWVVKRFEPSKKAPNNKSYINEKILCEHLEKDEAPVRSDAGRN